MILKTIEALLDNRLVYLIGTYGNDGRTLVITNNILLQYMYIDIKTQ